MFTGIVEEVGKVKAIGNGILQIEASKVLEDVQLGDSIAVNGICLTVTSFGSHSFQADVMPETLKRTSLGELKPGSPVNLERALTLASRLGGHIVSGHIDGTGRIVSLKDDKNAILMKIQAEGQILRYIVEKGSVALDGISLTVVQVSKRDFTVSLIPHTRQATNLYAKGEGALLNIENDVVGKYVEKLLQPAESPAAAMPKSSITLDFLRQNGF